MSIALKIGSDFEVADGSATALAASGGLVEARVDHEGGHSVKLHPVHTGNVAEQDVHGEDGISSGKY